MTPFISANSTALLLEAFGQCNTMYNGLHESEPIPYQRIDGRFFHTLHMKIPTPSKCSGPARVLYQRTFSYARNVAANGPPENAQHKTKRELLVQRSFHTLPPQLNILAIASSPSYTRLLRRRIAFAALCMA